MISVLEKNADLAQKLMSTDHATYLAALREIYALPNADAIELAWEIGLKHNDYIRIRMTQILSRKQSEYGQKLALMLIEEPRTGCHWHGFKHLIEYGDGSQTVLAEKTLLNDPDADHRLMAAGYLVCFGTNQHLPTLRLKLDDMGVDEEGRTVGGQCRNAIDNIELRMSNTNLL